MDRLAAREELDLRDVNPWSGHFMEPSIGQLGAQGTKKVFRPIWGSTSEALRAFTSI